MTTLREGTILNRVWDQFTVDRMIAHQSYGNRYVMTLAELLADMYTDYCLDIKEIIEGLTGQLGDQPLISEDTADELWRLHEQIILTAHLLARDVKAHTQPGPHGWR